MQLIEVLQAATEVFHSEADLETTRLLGQASAADYRALLASTYGFVFPVERAILALAGLSDYIDPRRFRKHELLRADLRALGMTEEEIERLPRCAPPVCDSLIHALGWAYVIECGTLTHNTLIHRLAMTLGVEIAFMSSFLKCYSGTAPVMWRELEVALVLLADSPARSKCLIESAKDGFRMLRSWRRDDGESFSTLGMSTIEFCIREHDGYRCMLVKGHDGAHEGIGNQGSMRWSHRDRDVGLAAASGDPLG